MVTCYVSYGNQKIEYCLSSIKKVGHWVFPLVSLRIITVGTPLYKVTPGQTAITEAMFWGNVIRNKMSLPRNFSKGERKTKQFYL